MSRLLQLKWWAVLVGTAVDHIASILIGTVHSLVTGPAFSTIDWIVSLSIGTLVTVIGAATAAVIAVDKPVRHGTAVGMVGMLTGFIIAFTAGATGPLWYAWAGLLAAIPAGALGGYLVALGKGRGRPRA